jgi:hypothetical protein
MKGRKKRPHYTIEKNYFFIKKRKNKNAFFYLKTTFL